MWPSAAVATLFLTGRRCDAYSYSHPTSSPLVLDESVPVSTNPLVLQAETSHVANVASEGDGGGEFVGIGPAVDPSTLETYGAGLVALYAFDNFSISSGEGLNGEAGRTPCELESSGGGGGECPDALLTWAAANPAENDTGALLLGPGRFDGGSALRVSPLPHVTGDTASVGTFAQILSGSPFSRNQPARGMTGAAWIKFEDGTWSDGVVWERQFGNFDASLRYGRCMACGIAGQDNVQPSVSHCLPDSAAADALASSGWVHLACTYAGPDQTLSLYVNGTLVASDSSVSLPHDLFRHGDNQPFGIGNRPGTASNPLHYAECCGNSAFRGLVDDFALWDRPLTGHEVLGLASSEEALAPSPRIVMTTKNIVRALGNEPGHPSESLQREFEALTVTWMTGALASGAARNRRLSSADNSDGLVVEISTDDGLNWCEVRNGEPFSDLFHGDPDGQTSCLFPSVTVKLRAIWTGVESVVLGGLSVDFWGESPLVEPGVWKDVDVGMNAAGVNYYQSQWVFTDAFQSGGGSSWPSVRSGTDADGWPLEIDPALDNDGTYWITGRNIILCCNEGNYPSGTYILVSEGKGTVRLSWDSGEHVVESPCRYEFDVVPTAAGVQVFVERSELGDHVRNIRVYMPGFAPPGNPFVPNTPGNSPPPPSPLPAPAPSPVSPPSPTAPSVGSIAPCATCLDGLVGYWPMDAVSDPLLSSSDGSVIVRAMSPSTVAGNDAYITGNGSSPPLTPGGKFGSALSIPLGDAGNFAQIFPSGLVQSAPVIGFAGSVWLRPESSSFVQGVVWERMFDNFSLKVESNNYVHCHVNGIDNQVQKVSYQLPPSLDPSQWIHAVCSYDGPSQTLKLFLDGNEKTSGVVVLPEGKFRHDDGAALGLGNRAGSVNNMGQFANSYHFVGDLDDFALWDRPLATEEVLALYSSGAAISDLVPAEPDSGGENYCASCMEGVVGHWTFDEIDGGDSNVISSADGATVVVRGASPSSSLAGGTASPATLAGSGSDFPLADDGRFGRALFVPPGKANWANVFPSGLLQDAPATGFAGSVWLRPAGSAFVQGTIWERMFGNFDLHTWSWNNYLRCRVHSSTSSKDIGYSMNGGGPLDPTKWFHAVCTYDPLTETLALYVNGVEVVSDVVSLGGTFRHGDGQPLGIGNRAGSLSDPGQFAGNGHFEGAIDDFALWNRHLTPDEIKTLFESGRPLLDQTPPEKDCVSCLDGIVGHYEFDETSNIVSSTDGSVIVRGTSTALAGVDATLTGDGSDPPLVQDGKFGSALSIPPGKANWVQLFPSGLSQIAPASGFAGSLWLRPKGTSFVQGGIFERMFGNFAMSTWSWNNYLRCGIIGSDNQNNDIGYSINSEGPMDTSKWIHAVCSYDGVLKKLSLFVDGEEKVSETYVLPDDKFRHGDGQPLGLGNRAGGISDPGQFAGDGHFEGAIDDFVLWNRPLTNEEVSKLYASGKPIKLQGQLVTTDAPTKSPTRSPTETPTHEPSKVPTPAPSTSSPSTQPSSAAPHPAPPTFHPAYLDSLSSFSLVRFMDWGHTNSNQVSQWKHRNTPSSVSQTHTFVVTRDIVSIVEADATAFSGQWLAKITTSSPHDLTTGQVVDVMHTDGLVTLESGETVTFNVSNAMIEVVDELNFLVSYRGWGWDTTTHNVQTFENGSTGTVSIRYRPGVSLEKQIELANTLGKDGWFNVPHLANDDYIWNMANMIKNTLAPGLKAYIEYSNEIWNWAPGFIQTRYAYNMASADGETRGDRHLVWYGRRCSHIFSIFDDVFGGRSQASTRIVRVVAVQAGTGSVQLDFAGGASDALAIAPYFGGSLNAAVHGTPGWESLSTDAILDLARREVVDSTLERTRQSAVYAEQYGVKLIAYEGGQHMGGGGGCGSAGDCGNIDALQQKFQAANHHPRIRGLYRNMLKAWWIGGGNQTGTFAAFSHIGYDSKYGSWGALQHQLDDVSTAWKYQALTGNIGN